MKMPLGKKDPSSSEGASGTKGINLGAVKKKKDKGMDLKLKSNKKVSVGKRTLTLVFCIAIVAGTLLVASMLLNKQNSKITVIRIKSDMAPGTLITEQNIEPYDMVYEDYENLGVITYDKQGERVSEQVIMLWADKEKVVNKYMSMYNGAGTVVTKRMLTDDLLIRSPWLEKVEDEWEVYTMQFGSKDIYTPIFYPGARIRIRMVYEVPVEEAPAIVARIKEKENQMKSGQYLGKGGDSVILEALQTATISDSALGFGSVSDKKVPLSEVIFDEIIVVDMLNSSNESIFDLYVDLLGKPIEQRIAYVKTQIEGTGQSQFKQKVTPNQLTFSVTREEANKLAEFEALNCVLKYTILPDLNEDYSLMTQFSELSGQLQSYIDNAPSASFR